MIDIYDDLLELYDREATLKLKFTLKLINLEKVQIMILLNTVDLDQNIFV